MGAGSRRRRGHVPALTGRDRVVRMRAATVAGRAAARQLREALAATERELALERQQLADAERRGRLAAEIDDRETVAVAERYAGRHGERVRVLERKLEAQRAELDLVERDVADMTAQLEALEGGTGAEPGAGPRAADRPDDDPLLRYRMDQAAKESAAEEMLRALKRRMGKE